MNKKLIISILLIISFSIIYTVSFAAENTLLQNGVNGVRNIVGNAENVIENAAQGAAGAIKNGTNNIESGLNTAVDDMSNNNDDMNNDNNYMVGTTDNNNNNENYTAARTATFMGMDGNTWTWFVIGIVGIAIIALVWAYSMQDTNTEHNRH